MYRTSLTTTSPFQSLTACFSWTRPLILCGRPLGFLHHEWCPVARRWRQESGVLKHSRLGLLRQVEDFALVLVPVLCLLWLSTVVAGSLMRIFLSMCRGSASGASLSVCSRTWFPGILWHRVSLDLRMVAGAVGWRRWCGFIWVTSSPDLEAPA